MIFTAEQMAILEEDKGLSAEQLDDQYNPEGGGSHPVVTRAGWREHVASQDTLSGYWDWVAYRIALATGPQLVGTAEGGISSDQKVAFAISKMSIND
jgi:hypothetical protein